MCPSGLVSDGKGGCILESSCPCVYNGNTYTPGETLSVDCNQWSVWKISIFIDKNNNNNNNMHIGNCFLWSLLFLSCFSLHSKCTNRRFECTKNVCDEVCSIYGDGHYSTFDEKKFDFSGQCEYTLIEVKKLSRGEVQTCNDARPWQTPNLCVCFVQDYCDESSGTFRVITENVPCGSTGTTCSRAIKIFMGVNWCSLG